jgi:molybdate transport system ATP-binding protein
MIRFDCTLRWPSFTLDAAFESSGGVTALFGPSGSGKSSILRLLAGLARPDRGLIRLDDAVLLDTAAGIAVPPHKRGIGLVFQDNQLLPHLSVRRNLLYGRSFAGRGDRRIAFDAVVETLAIPHLLERAPASLSGGERQRVAIGRALLAAPRLLLMDEPLASLDANLKLEILPFIERLRDEFAIPIVYVSHAAEEVARLSQTVVRLEHGRVVATGPAAEVLASTALAHAAERFEAVSMLSGRVSREEPRLGVTILQHPAGEIVLPWRVASATEVVRIAVRATNVTLAFGRPNNVSIRTALAGRVVRVERDRDGGPFALVAVELRGGDRLLAYMTRLALEEMGLDAGDEVFALIKTVSLDERGITGLTLTQRG